jgi:threonylcarbamoyladenosine tRNA methylthiotransferase MtaB
LKATGKYQDHFHIPLQSGSDEVLSSMRRKYTSSQYKEILSMVKSYFPDAAFGADVIVGYPGETEEQFLETFNLLRAQPITHFHVFPYSKRKGTTAAKLENQIQTSVKKDRVRTLMMLGDAKLDEFSGNMVGKETEVLFENEVDGFWEGYSSNYLRVRVKSDADLRNSIHRVSVTAYHGKLDGKLI